MEHLNLNATIRDKKEKHSKQLPAIVYGKNMTPLKINMEYSDFLRAFRKVGKTQIITLSVGNKKIETIVHEIQKHPVTDDFSHIDFYAISKGNKVHTDIPLRFTGESSAIKEGNILDEHTKSIEVKCLPKDLVDNFEVDLSVLKQVGDSIKISQLGIDTQKYEILSNLEDTVLVVNKPKTQEVIPTTAPESNIPEEENK